MKPRVYFDYYGSLCCAESGHADFDIFTVHERRWHRFEDVFGKAAVNKGFSLAGKMAKMIRGSYSHYAAFHARGKMYYQERGVLYVQEDAQWVISRWHNEPTKPTNHPVEIY
jgi:hypothetical protein